MLDTFEFQGYSEFTNDILNRITSAFSAQLTIEIRFYSGGSVLFKRPPSFYLRLTGRAFSRGLVLCAAWVMIQTGAWFWLDGFRAVRPDHDPATELHLEQVLDEDTWGDDDSIEGGFIIYGNGNSDDDREKAFVLKRWAGAPISPQAPARAVSNFGERRTTSAYNDFGHLKVMPAADDSDFNNCSRSSFKKRLPALMRAAFIITRFLAGRTSGGRSDFT